jgi:sulfonate transport system ATP-binding protein
MTANNQSAGGVSVAIEGLRKRFGAREVLRGADLHIDPGEFVAIVGRSGCGKSTLLRVVAGLEEANAGAVTIDGRAVAGIASQTRIMFQDSRLLPWRRVWDNVTLGLPKEKSGRATDVLAQVGLSDRAEDWPARLSGGQRQRVALARALVHEPRLLLLDEPLGALDALTRIEMQRLIERLWRRSGFTALLVTHDVHEAVALADRVILIEEGRIALDQRIPLARPRVAGDPSLAELEKRILDRVLQRPDTEPAPDRHWLGTPAYGLRWAI